MKEINYNNLESTLKNLLNQAEQAVKTAYNPYSQFAVGAALLTNTEKIIIGSNVENAAYGNTICAERAAILSANAQGFRHFKAIAIIAKNSQKAVSPCGACRQVLYEFAQLAGIDLQIIMSSSQKEHIVIASISELLPMGFGPKDLVD